MATLMHDLRSGGRTPEPAWRATLDAQSLEPLKLDEIARPGITAHILAPHPDDEILGAAGLLQHIARAGARTIIHALTDGEGSHPSSPAWPKLKLIQTRREEALCALRALQISFERRRLSLADGALAASEGALYDALEESIGPDDFLIAPWRFDGHPDHEAAGRVARRLAEARGLALLEMPIWGWERCLPGDGAMPLERARKLDLNEDDLKRKLKAIDCFNTQIERDPSTGKPPILGRTTLAHFMRPFEIFFYDRLRP